MPRIQIRVQLIRAFSVSPLWLGFLGLRPAAAGQPPDYFESPLRG